MEEPRPLPGWLKIANPIFMTLIRLGVPVGTQHVLTVRGRRSGKPYSTPVSLLTVDWQRYICTFPWTGWARNARVVRQGELVRGRTRERVRLSELPADERAPILREFPVQVPHVVQFFQLPPEPEAFAQAAPRLAVFRVEPLSLAPASESAAAVQQELATSARGPGRRGGADMAATSPRPSL